jgi:hypothetical protein
MCLLPLFFGMAAANAQPRQSDTLEMKVYFRQGESRVDPAFRDNAARLTAFQAGLEALLADSSAVVRYVSVRASASPEGNTAVNRQLSEARSRSMEHFLRESLPLDPLLFRYRSVGEDWEALADLVRPLDVPWRDEALEIIEHTPVWISRNGRVVDGRKRQLMLLRGGEAWRWLDREVFPELRAAGGQVRCIIYRPVPEVPVRPDTVYVDGAVTDTVYIDRPTVVPSGEVQARRHREYDLSGRKLLFALRTNALAVPLANIGVEVPLGGRWSIGADWYYPWIWRPQHGEGLDYSGVCNELLALDLELRLWFPDRHRRNGQRLLGHSVGLYAAAGHYDFERDRKGWQGEFANIGADYLYACPVFGGRMHLEFELGIGYIYSPARPYDSFYEGGKAFRRSGVTRYTRWFGPTRAQISITVPLYGSKRGGVR